MTNNEIPKSWKSEQWAEWRKIAKERGAAISEANARGVADGFMDLDLEWVIRFKIPLLTAVSKNSIYGRAATRHHRPFIKKAAKDYRDAITLLTKTNIRESGIDVKHNKVWLDIFVEKPHNKMDAVNVIDMVCDAIKVAIPVDDKWYSIRRLDWSVNKVDPHLFIGIGQETGVDDAKTCRYCGRIRPLTDFTFSKSDYLGRSSTCSACRLPSYPKGPNKKNR